MISSSILINSDEIEIRTYDCMFILFHRNETGVMCVHKRFALWGAFKKSDFAFPRSKNRTCDVFLVSLLSLFVSM